LSGLERALLLLGASNRLVWVGRRLVLVCAILLAIGLSFSLLLLLFWLFGWSWEFHFVESGGGVVDDTHGLVLSRLHGRGVDSALHGALVGREQVGVRLASDLLVGNFLLQCRDGVLVEVIGAEALGSDLEGARALGRGNGRVGCWGVHGWVFYVDEAGTNLGKGSAVGIRDTQA
jgi:hypothetical protein